VADGGQREGDLVRLLRPGWCSQAAGSTQREYGEVEHKPETVEAWVGELCRRFGPGPIAVAAQWPQENFFESLGKCAPGLLFRARGRAR